MHKTANRSPIGDIPFSAVFTALGTVNSIRIDVCQNRAAAEQALGRAKERVLALHEKLSVFRPDSEISLLNASAGGEGVSLSEDTLLLLSESRRYSRLSDKAFSVTTRALSALWEIHARCGSIPNRVEVERARALVEDQDILIDETARTAWLRRPGQSVDLGAIAKGFAADEVRRILLQGGATSALVNLGGTVVSIGAARQVGIQHPDRTTGAVMGRILLKDGCAVTSGDYERYYEVDGVRYHHIVDPRTGYPSQADLRSVTLIGKSALALDALSTAIFVLGAEQGAHLIAEAGAEAVFVDCALNVFCTEGLRGNFELLQP
jgi:FAD:protein FMN transferase